LATLPPKLGGFGIQDPITTHRAAYLAASVVATKANIRFNAYLCSIHSYDVQKSTQLVPAWRPLDEDVEKSLILNGTAALLHDFRELFSSQDDVELSLIEIASSKSNKLQAKLTIKIHEETLKSIYSSWSTADINRLHSCSREGGIIITASPAYEDNRISLQFIFRERLLMRLGLPYYEIPTGYCHCNKNIKILVDREGYHLSAVCPKGGERQAKHNAILCVVSQMCTHAGLTNRREDSEVLKLIDIDTKERIDLVVDNFLPGISLNIDVAVCDPRQLRGTTPEPGKAAKMREQVKNKHYLERIERTGSKFHPFVLESFGRWGEEARQIFDQIIERMTFHGSTTFFNLPKSWIVHYWRSRITMALHRQACIGMHKRINALKQSYRGLSGNFVNPPFVETHDPCAAFLAIKEQVLKGS
jgi:hypothetical protein